VLTFGFLSCTATHSLLAVTSTLGGFLLPSQAVRQGALSNRHTMYSSSNGQDNFDGLCIDPRLLEHDGLQQTGTWASPQPAMHDVEGSTEEVCLGLMKPAMMPTLIVGQVDLTSNLLEEVPSADAFDSNLPSQPLRNRYTQNTLQSWPLGTGQVALGYGHSQPHQEHVPEHSPLGSGRPQLRVYTSAPPGGALLCRLPDNTPTTPEIHVSEANAIESQSFVHQIHLSSASTRPRSHTSPNTPHGPQGHENLPSVTPGVHSPRFLSPNSPQQFDFDLYTPGRGRPRNCSAPTSPSSTQSRSRSSGSRSVGSARSSASSGPLCDDPSCDTPHKHFKNLAALR